MSKRKPKDLVCGDVEAYINGTWVEIFSRCGWKHGLGYIGIDTPREARALAKWLVQWADWVEAKGEKR
jgi:hypothetical protein